MIRPLLAACAGLALVLAAGPASATTHGDTGFVTRHGDDLTLNGKEFRFAGSNNYYLMYRSPAMVDDVFADAKAAGFTVLRTWGFLDIGAQDDTGSVHHKENGVYFQYWDGTRPAYNDGPDGLQHLDQVVKSARDKGIRLVIPLTNNWSAFGGMDQYVRWRGGAHHDDFYTDPVIRGWYKDWISHVLNRTNSLTGVKYKDDPTIMAWELANEPRCVGSGVYPRSAACTDATVTAWAADISAHLDGVDRRHLISSGDEGFLCTDRASADFTVNCADGVDSAALAALPAVDFMSFHLYPDHWKKDPSWGSGWITTHARLAGRLRKPVMLGEFGLLDKASRNVVYQQWTDAAVSARLDGFLYWILSGVQDDGTDYPDYDGFTVYCPSPVCTTVANAGDELRHGRRSRPPVADHDTAQTLRDDPATLTPAANDIAYRTRVKAATIDLDPAAAGRQTTVTLPGGSFGLNAKTGVVTFTPAAGFVGRVAAPYTIRDEAGRTSNVAELRVTVKNRPGDALVLASFEAGTEGWAAASWQSDAGTVARTTEFHPEGSAGLRVTTADGGWFGVTGLTGVDLSGKSALRYELRTTTGTSTSIAVQTGDAYTWCQSTWGYASAGSTTTVEADLATGMSCDAAALADVRAVYVWFDGNGTHDIDHLRAQ
ncbi:cellulase family glycosylhydrolase [Dactylosporangium sp. NPDC050588]|uniref:cellulase family glycosylhydrolase n=1 Tax=Dactylosporangium sp. NPDC050588 TaxID=3157211 RepID=UPI0033D82D38